MLRSARLALAVVALMAAAAPAALAQKTKLKYPKPVTPDVYDAVEKPAQPAGGLEAYGNYLGDKLNYPTTALRAGVQGTVEVTFVVEKTGATSNWEVTKSLSPECDAEALRLVKAGPRWTPAEHKGGVVRQRVTVPITFQIPAGSETAGTAAAPAPSAPSSAANPAGLQTVAPEEPARPVGGTEAWFEWVQKEQKYPVLARQRKVQGKVMMEFVIEKDGSLTNIKPVQRLGSGLDEEAIRIVKASPKWEPAKYKGAPIRQKMVLPILFQL
ncbi:energy transducer TonB [Hymenobacter sp. 15J16-1T3B]|uniref:energy transducer TonB n=1 Tax=Hymenobacter sp. 15J16-1T3B TaxID=2886941 RepID=UPI001D10E553|nr:energy transducer TonB [Hymenobacter sp. 15J16-1T3B]MCC3157663.1 energy transducer TonB [Hymenobacter sp. 15J16-1T3B]